MIIGVPKEIKPFENRTGLTPASISELVKENHIVYVQKGAGEGSGFSDMEYLAAGARLSESIENVYEKAELIVKVKEPQEQEYPLLNKRHILFTYLHLASSGNLTKALMESGATCIAYETVQKKDGSLPLLIPMSEIAGRLAVIEGSKYLQKTYGGKGKLISGVPGVSAAKVVIIGGGIVGTNSARLAAGLGASVTILDKSGQRLRYLEDILPPNVKTLFSNRINLENELKTADLVIGAVLIPGAEAPKLIMRKDLSLLEKGTVMVDVAVDQGGCFETTKPTTHADPVYITDNILHYCVANMPGCVPRTSTEALNNVTLPYVAEIATKGLDEALKNPELSKGLNIRNGRILLDALM